MSGWLPEPSSLLSASARLPSRTSFTNHSYGNGSSTLGAPSSSWRPSASTPYPSRTSSSIRSSMSAPSLASSTTTAPLPSSSLFGGSSSSLNRFPSSGLHSDIGGSRVPHYHGSTSELSTAGGILGGIDYQIDSGYFGATRDGISRHNHNKCTICAWTHELFAQLRDQESHAGETLARSAAEQRKVLEQLRSSAVTRDRAVNDAKAANELIHQLQQRLDDALASSKNSKDTIDAYHRAFHDGMQVIHHTWNHDHTTSPASSSASSRRSFDRTRRDGGSRVAFGQYRHDHDDDRDDGREHKFFYAPMHSGHANNSQGRAAANHRNGNYANHHHGYDDSDRQRAAMMDSDHDHDGTVPAAPLTPGDISIQLRNVADRTRDLTGGYQSLLHYIGERARSAHQLSLARRMFTHWHHQQQRRLALKAAFQSVRIQQPVRLMARVYRAWREVYWRTRLQRFEGDDLHIATNEVKQRRQHAAHRIAALLRLVNQRAAWRIWCRHSAGAGIDMIDAAWHANHSLLNNGGISRAEQLIAKATRHLAAHGRRLPGQSLLAWSFTTWLQRYRAKVQRIIAARRLMVRWRRQHLRSALNAWLRFTLHHNRQELTETKGNHERHVEDIQRDAIASHDRIRDDLQRVRDEQRRRDGDVDQERRTLERKLQAADDRANTVETRARDDERKLVAQLRALETAVDDHKRRAAKATDDGERAKADIVRLQQRLDDCISDRDRRIGDIKAATQQLQKLEADTSERQRQAERRAVDQRREHDAVVAEITRKAREEHKELEQLRDDHRLCDETIRALKRDGARWQYKHDNKKNTIRLQNDSDVNPSSMFMSSLAAFDDNPAARTPSPIATPSPIPRR